MESHDTQAILEPISLPCGRKLSNRLVKVALYEHCAAMLGGPPNETHYKLYSQWSKGRWGMIMTGNFQVCDHHISTGRDVIIPMIITEHSIGPFKRLADSMHQNTDAAGPLGDHKPLAIMQLCHAGRQSNAILGGRLPWVPPLAPSAITVGGKGSDIEGFWPRLIYKFVFSTPKAMSIEDIDDTVSRFVHGARVALESGFDGVQLHASHGYLLAQFISVKTNRRDDEYSAVKAPLHLLDRIARGIRKIVPPTFVLGVKLNAADYLDSEISDQRVADTKRAQEDRALDHVKEIASWQLIDFIEVSGGDYENPDFMSTPSPRQAFFSRFSRRALSALPPPDYTSRPPLILLTGGLRDYSTMTTVLTENHAHLLGVGRLSVLVPDLPIQIKEQGAKFISPPIPDPSAPALDHYAASILKSTNIQLPKLVNAGAECSWYFLAMKKMAAGYRKFDHGSTEALIRMWCWIAPQTGFESRYDFWGIIMVIFLLLLSLWEYLSWLYKSSLK